MFSLSRCKCTIGGLSIYTTSMSTTVFAIFAILPFQNGFAFCSHLSQIYSILYMACVRKRFSSTNIKSLLFYVLIWRINAIGVGVDLKFYAFAYGIIIFSQSKIFWENISHSSYTPINDFSSSFFSHRSFSVLLLIAFY